MPSFVSLLPPAIRPVTGAAAIARLPQRVRTLVEAQEAESERLIGWVQLTIAGLFALLYLAAPRPIDSPMRLVAPVPLALAIYTAFTVARLRLAHRRRLPHGLLVASILADVLLLAGLIWSFHGEYGQQPAFSLKVPTFIYMVVFVSLRALRFEPRYVIAAGLAAAAGWGALTLGAIALSPPGTVTRSFTAYLNGTGILVGAELDKIIAVLIVTGVLAFAVARAQRTLVTAVREAAARREIERFLSFGVADAIADAEAVIAPGQAVERDAAILMLDIRGFTRFSATVAPSVVVEALTRWHARIVPIARRNGGAVDKFLGDGVMLTFGAVTPSATAAADSLRALEAILAEVRPWQAEIAALGIRQPLDVNGAVAAGRVVFAALGSEDRLEYTVIGDAANLAAKLEKQNKVEGSRALAAANAYDLAVAQGWRGKAEPLWRRVVTVAGGAEPVEAVAF